jgi:hypothetical protein
MPESDATGPRSDGATTASPLPPYRVFENFLDDAVVHRLLGYACAHEADFAATTLRKGTGEIVDPSYRLSSYLVDFGPDSDRLKEKLLALVPDLIRELRVTPFETSRIELELVAHGDGAFYKRHIDTFTSTDQSKTTQRMLSGVYYFHVEPRAFSGGALRLHPFGGADPDARFIDIEPQRNRLVVFPSWAPHEVLQVSCPSRRFLDSRFAVNCWIRRRKPEQRPFAAGRVQSGQTPRMCSSVSSLSRRGNVVKRAN